MLVDFHTHCFPDKIAPTAIQKLSFVSGGLIPHTDGTVEGLKKSMAEGSIDISVVLNIATNPNQQQKVNNFAAQVNEQEGLVAFGSVFPGSDDAFVQLERIKELGLKGVKLHPDYQGFTVDDPSLKPFYRKISELGLITVFHAGVDYGFAPPYCCMPQNLRRALDWFDSPVIAAHWGGLGCYDQVLEHLCGENVYFDTSFGFSQMPKFYAQKILEKHGADKLLFGTDSPWHTPQMELRLLENLELSPDDMDKITHLNAQKLLGL